MHKPQEHVDREILATVNVGSRIVEVRNAPEFKAFCESVVSLEPEKFIQLAVWLVAKAHQLVIGISSEVKFTADDGTPVSPQTTKEAETLVDALFELDDLHRIAAAKLLGGFAKQLSEIVIGNNPSFLPDTDRQN